MTGGIVVERLHAPSIAAGRQVELALGDVDADEQRLG
jgi:hypothetical protein